MFAQCANIGNLDHMDNFFSAFALSGRIFVLLIPAQGFASLYPGL